MLFRHPFISITQPIGGQTSRSRIAHAGFELSLVAELSQTVRFLGREVELERLAMFTTGRRLLSLPLT
jgi:hypothetical protein